MADTQLFVDRPPDPIVASRKQATPRAREESSREESLGREESSGTVLAPTRASAPASRREMLGGEVLGRKELPGSPAAPGEDLGRRPGVRPELRPASPHFSTGPTAKPPSWSLNALEALYVPGRSHRSQPCKAQLEEVVERSLALLELPAGWLCAIVPGSDTGAVELALWTFLSEARGVDVLSFDSFSAAWAKDVSGSLGLKNVRVLEADYGKVPDLERLNFDRDVVLTWNGTTAGTCLPADDFIPAQRKGLVICDATSAAFAIPMPFEKLDVVTWSWQKCLGGEGGHGMIALSPAAQNRLNAGDLPRGLPKVFDMTKAGKVNASLFQGATLNTPSMLAVADHLLGLEWAQEIGGLSVLYDRVAANYQAVAAYVEASPNWDFLATDPAVRSPTALCLTCTHPRFVGLEESGQRLLLKQLQKRLEALEVAYDIGSYRNAPPGLRLWGGPTVAAADLAALMPWIDWALELEIELHKSHEPHEPHELHKGPNHA